MKKKLVFIVIMLILLSLGLSIKLGGLIGKRDLNLSKSKIINISILNTDSNIKYSKGYAKFYPNEESVFGSETADSDYVIDKNTKLRLNNAGEPSLLETGSSTEFYELKRLDYLGIFEKIKIENFDFFNSSIYVNRKKLKEFYPEKDLLNPKKNISSLHWSLYSVANNNKIDSIKIDKNWQGQPIRLSIAIRANPNYYIPIYELSYSNDIKAYNKGFDKMKHKIENTDVSDSDD